MFLTKMRSRQCSSCHGIWDLLLADAVVVFIDDSPNYRREEDEDRISQVHTWCCCRAGSDPLGEVSELDGEVPPAQGILAAPELKREAGHMGIQRGGALGSH